MRHTRITGWTIIAGFVLSSLAPTLASAHEFNAKTTPITAEGTNHIFTAGEAIIKCAKAEFKYTGATGKFPSVSIVPAYQECFVHEQEAKVTVEKAEFKFGVVKEVKSGEFSLTSAIVGEGEARLKVTATIEGQSCEVIFPAQAIAGEATKFVNNGGKTGGEVKTKLEKVEYKSNSKCGSGIAKEAKNGKYEGNAAEIGLIIE